MKYLDQLHPDADFVAIDVETTGRSTEMDVVTEIGAIRYKSQVEIGRFVTLVKPATTMLPWIARLTGITDDMLARAPAPSEVAGRLHRFLSRRPLVVHNASFDVPIVERFLSRHARPERKAPAGPGWMWFAPPTLCTLRMSRRFLPHLRSRRLSAVAEYFDFMPRDPTSPRFHRAGTDAEAAAHIFFCLSAMSRGKEQET